MRISEFDFVVSDRDDVIMHEDVIRYALGIDRRPVRAVQILEKRRTAVAYE